MNSILNAVGNTPLVHLKSFSPAKGAQILAKVESLNPGGSIKIRPSLYIIEEAERTGKLTPSSTIMEVTSGNQGIALALIGAIKGYRVKILMPKTMSHERVKLMQSYGAEIILTPEKGGIRDALNHALKIGETMAQQDSSIFFVRQFQNPLNPLSYYKIMAKEILSQIKGPVDAFAVGFGTAGTLMGIGKALKENFPKIKIVVAEPKTASLLTKNKVFLHHAQAGIGDGILPDFFDKSFIDEIILVDDEDALNTARTLAKKEGLLCGVSSGTNVWAASKIAEKLGPTQTVLTVLPDTGERYITTGLFGK